MRSAPDLGHEGSSDARNAEALCGGGLRIRLARPHRLGAGLQQEEVFAVGKPAVDRPLDVLGRAALALDRGLEADDREVRKALADYGDGDMRPPLARGARCTIRAWRDGGIDVIEREADSSDDDGGKPGTDVRFCKVENVPGGVVGVRALMDGAGNRFEAITLAGASQAGYL